MSTTLSIFEVVKLTRSNGIVLESRRIKDDKGVFNERWFINRVGVRGSLMISLGDCTREGEEPPYERPFLGKKPERHPDSPADSTSKGALTIIPNKEEGEAWIEFNRWIKREILRVGAVKDKKGNVVSTMEKLESEFKDIVVEPDLTNEARKNVCFWQKFQIGGKFADLNTTFQYLKCVTDADGNKHIEQGPKFDEEAVLKAGMPIYSIIQLGELKKAPSGWGITMYTRRAYTDSPSEDDGSEPVIMFGGIKVVSSAPPAPAKTASPKPASPVVFTPPPNSNKRPADASKSISESGAAGDISDLTKNLAKFSDPDRVDSKRVKTAP